MGDEIEGDIHDTMDKAVKQIYLSCDRDNTDSVPVSTLVAFVKPYMPAELNELENLQGQLDPDNSDPAISSSFFYRVMHDWASEIKEYSAVNENSNSFAETGENQALFVPQSTPNSQRYYQLVKSCSKILNNSQVSLYETENNNTHSNTDGVEQDKSIVQQQLHEMENHIQRMSNELDLVKQQLAVAEEQNECLASENRKITKSLHTEQQTNKQLRKTIDTMEELKENANLRNKKIKQLEKTITSLRNDQLKFCNEKNQLEDRNYDLCTKLDISSRVTQSHAREITELKNLIDIHESDIEDLTKQKNELQTQLEEKNELVKFYINENDLLKHQSVEKKYQENSEMNQTSFSENNFNSPHLLHQLANPISPKFDTPILWKETVLKNHRSTPIGVLSPPEINSSKRSQISPQDSYEEFESCNDISFQKSKKLRILPNQKSLLEELLEVSEPNESHLEDILKHLTDTVNDNNQLKNEILLLNSSREELREMNEKNVEVIEKSKEMVVSLCAKLDKCLPVQIDTKIKNPETPLLDELQELVILIEYLFSKKEDDGNSGNTLPFNSGGLSERQRMKVDIYQIQTESVLAELEAQKAQCFQIQAELFTQNAANSQLRENLNEISSKYKIELELLQSQVKQAENEKTESAGRLQDQETEISQLRAEKLQLERDFNNARNRNAELCFEVANKRVQEFEAMCKKEMECLRLCLLQLQEENVILRLESDNLKAQLQQLGNVNQQFLIKQQFYEHNMQEEKNKQEKLMERINFFQSTIVDVEGILQEKSKEITKLKSILRKIETKIRFDNSELVRFVSSVRFNENEEENAVESVRKQIEQVQKQENLGCHSCEKELLKLSEYVKILFGLLRFALDRYKHLPSSEELERTDEESAFNSCFSEISRQWLEDFQYQIRETDELDLFVESFSIAEAENVRNLSREQMEHKFTSFALTLPLDVRSSKKRYQNQDKLYSEQILKYLEYLNRLINSLMRLNRNHSEDKENLKSALTLLQLFKNTTLDVVKSAEKCGLLHYEKRAASLWNFVVNYVAVLTKENKKRPPQIVENLHTTKFTQSKPIYRRKTFWTKLIRPSLVFIITVFLLILLMFFYVQWKCKNERQAFICPLDWILDRIIHTTNYPIL